MKALLILLFALSSCYCYEDDIMITRKRIADLDIEIKETIKADTVGNFDDLTLEFLLIDKAEAIERLQELEAKSHCL